MKILFSFILSLIFLVFWSCSDAGKDPLSSGDETDCTQELDCNTGCGGAAINDACGVCDGNGSSCNISYSQIQEIFNSKCILCHNGSHSSGLDLRTYAGVTDGGNSGLVIANNHANSLLWNYVNTDYMPPNGTLFPSQIILIGTWIDEGALEEPLDN